MNAGGFSKSLWIAGLLTSTAMSAAPAWAQDNSGYNDEIVVTAQKREENLQDVPLSITAIGAEKLDQLEVSDFDDYARYLPSLSYQTAGPGASVVYFRGIASGETINHSGQLPSVGTYLDEAPITTIQGALDLHVYDVARIEALAGPQGTLYGASSQAGTVRIITNKPDTSGFYGEVKGEVNWVAHGEMGYVGEGFVNLPISSSAALRVVGWYDKKGGYIDNIPGTRVFPTLSPGGDIPGTNTVTNAALVEDDYNDVTVYGGRAALKLDLDDNWTITPQVMGQIQKTQGYFGYELGLGAYKVQQYNPEYSKDKWYQAALTIEGKIGSFDVTYAGTYLDRLVTSANDYSDYAYYYDALFGYGAYYVDNNGDPLSNQTFYGRDAFTKQSHELRFNWESGPARLIFGGFYQRQTHNIQQVYVIPGFADAYEVPGWNDTIWLTKQYRVDRDYAVFGDLTVDISPKVSATLGTRIFKYDNTLVGFFGYGAGFSSGTGEAACFAAAVVAGSPCTNLDKQSKDWGFIHKVNLTWRPVDDVMFYATMSRGFRPGGINRRGTLEPFGPDYVDNYEAGWKTSFGPVRFNGAIYQLDWTDMQFSYLGANGLTEIQNAGNARVRGIEAELAGRWGGLTASVSGSYNDAKLASPYCRISGTADCSIPAGNVELAPKGARLPITPEFKGNAQLRYEFPIAGGDGKAYFQAAAVYQTSVLFDLRTAARAAFGKQDGYGTVDFSTGGELAGFSLDLYVRNAFDVVGGTFRTAQCGVGTCGGTLYSYPVQPRTIGVKIGRKF
ncbi:TonB-dependent receptor [Sphingomonas canadensis]|uniref:TonB-dependent receptor n=1 Tax=Sphingomonas canadensis TaxID=1219257 RepID=A0ABW3H6Y5_9SPHN|nr:TonB-dependent receptor [Sphingomonas canadensis]MCW3837094.1 TonB-dependent receptor [Sphingomonas canadensis]